MKIRNFYIKYQDKIEIIKAYFGVILILILTICFNLVPTNLEGMFNNQVETIIEICMGPTLGFCP